MTRSALCNRSGETGDLSLIYLAGRLLAPASSSHEAWSTHIYIYKNGRCLGNPGGGIAFGSTEKAKTEVHIYIYTKMVGALATQEEGLHVAQPKRQA